MLWAPTQKGLRAIAQALEREIKSRQRRLNQFVTGDADRLWVYPIGGGPARPTQADDEGCTHYRCPRSWADGAADHAALEAVLDGPEDWGPDLLWMVAEGIRDDAWGYRALALYLGLVLVRHPWASGGANRLIAGRRVMF